MNNKADLRQQYKKIRDNISIESRKVQDKLIAERFFAVREYKIAKTVFIYVSLGSEAETKEIIKKMISDGKRVVVPKCDIKTHTMRTFIISDLKQLAVGAYGIEEPIDGCAEVQKDGIDLAVIPGVCFDLTGNRLGYGGGYYDRFLENYSGFSIGLSYDECIAESVPVDKHDCKVDLIISADGVR